jgi:predicted AAA+ superfamily ATPase
MLRHLFPCADYRLLEDPEIAGRVKTDPRGFLEELSFPVILDEIQNCPELFAHVRARIDERPETNGQWLITGSQEAPLMGGVSESMAGRAAILQLFPFSYLETEAVSMLTGGFPEVLKNPPGRRVWFSSYLQTYLERDVRAVTAVKDLSVFRRFLSLLASRHGQALNRTDIATPLGVSVPTINQWLSILEATQQILVVPPYYDNFGKRLVKSPKIYWADSGLACNLLGIETAAELAKSPFLGSIFEGFIASEIVKQQVNRGKRRELYFFRDQQGLEVDFLVRGKNSSVIMIECKSGKTVNPSMAKPLQSLSASLSAAAGHHGEITKYIVHEATAGCPGKPMKSVCPGVSAVPWPELFAELSELL